MALFKISIHCGQVNTYTVEEHADKDCALAVWKETIDSSHGVELIRIGDVLINTQQVTFIVVEEVIAKAEEPAAGATVDV
jgi:hypothetical protein